MKHRRKVRSATVHESDAGARKGTLERTLQDLQAEELKARHVQRERIARALRRLHPMD
jgi:hypothetical protein